MIDQRVLDARMRFFRTRCAQRGLALTHQRCVIYRILSGAAHHPTPEQVFEEVRREVPSISLATVYKNIRVFLALGLLKEVKTFGQTMRLDANFESHYHLICASCATIFDMPSEHRASIQLKRGLPRGFQIERLEVNILGLCRECSPRVRSST